MSADGLPAGETSGIDFDKSNRLQLARRSREVMYVELSANPGAGKITIVFGLVEDGSALRPEEWAPQAEPLWEPLLGLIATICGEDRSSWIVSRVRAKFRTHHPGKGKPFPGRVELERTIAGIRMPGRWKMLEVVLALDEVMMIHSINDDLIHLYVLPHAEYSPFSRIEDDNSDESVRVARELRPALNDSVTNFVATYFSDNSMGVEFTEPAWEEENMPVWGASSFEYVGVITKGSAARSAISTKSPVSVFMCHGREDKPRVRELTRQLQETDFIACWFDEEQLLAGQDWELEIAKAVRASDAFIVCLSESSSTRTGYLQKEIRRALDVAQERPEGSIYIIPVRLEPCEVPSRLRELHWVDLFKPDGTSRLLRSLAEIRVAGATKKRARQPDD